MSKVQANVNSFERCLEKCIGNVDVRVGHDTHREHDASRPWSGETLHLSIKDSLDMRSWSMLGHAGRARMRHVIYSREDGSKRQTGGRTEGF